MFDTLYTAAFNDSSGTWGTASSTAYPNVGFRATSLSSAFPTTAMGSLNYSTATTSYGFAHSAEYNSGFSHAQDLSTIDIGTPVAVAAAPTLEVIEAYRKQASSYYTSETNQICYRISTDGGSTYGTEVCPTDLTSSMRPGISAAYDATTKTFLLAYALDNGTMRVLVLPGSGSTTPRHITDLTDKSWHAPVIACQGGSTSVCRMAWDDHTANTCLTWYEASVASSTGVFTAATKRQQCFALFDSPSLVYHTVDSTFRLAFRQGGAAYSYKMAASGGTSWTGTGDIWNSTFYEISGPTLSSEWFCFFSCAGTLRAWTLRWF